jgi:hypothetical protein
MPDDDSDNGGEEDGDGEFQFEAGGESCDACQALNGAIYNYCPSLPHLSCQCAIVPTNQEFNGWSITDWQSVHAGKTLTLYVHITVVCCDGTTGDTVVELPFELDWEKLEKKYPNMDDIGEAYFEELDSLIHDGVMKDAEDFMSEVCKGISCGGNIS